MDIKLPLLFLNNVLFQGLPDMTGILIVEAEIVCTFASMKNKAPSGYAGTSNRILKSCRLLPYIFNKPLIISKFPDHLKYLVVNPSFKK